MRKTTLYSTVALFTWLSAGVGMAQSQSPTPAPPASDITGSTPSTFYTGQEKQDWLSRNLVGTKVTNPQNETVGDVTDLVLEPSGKVKAVVLSVGGFLGIGTRYVAVNYDALKLSREDNGTVTANLNTTRDQLKSAPEFAYPTTNLGSMGGGDRGTPIRP